MIAQRRVDVADLNRRARAHMRAAGRLGQDELSLPGGSFAVGDIVVVKRNDPRAGLHNGDRAVVSAVNRSRSAIELDCDGRRINVGRGFLYARTSHGDATLVHGYAITGHIAQGLTVDRGFVLAEPGLTREWGYTALTRGREANHLYLSAEGDTQRHEYAPAAPRETRTDALTALARALSADSAHHLAVDATGAHGEMSRRDVAERMAAQEELHRARCRRIELEHGVRRWMPGQRRALEAARTEEARAVARLRQPHHRDAAAEATARAEARARRPLSEKADDLERLRRSSAASASPPSTGSS